MNTIEGPVTTHAKFDRFDLMKRVQQKNSTDRTQHIKAFAGECLDLTGRLLVWACFVLLPAGRLLEDMLCLSLLHDIGHFCLMHFVDLNQLKIELFGLLI